MSQKGPFEPPVVSGEYSTIDHQDGDFNEWGS